MLYIDLSAPPTLVTTLVYDAGIDLNQHSLNSRNPTKMEVMVTRSKMRLMVGKRKRRHGGMGNVAAKGDDDDGLRQTTATGMATNNGGR